MGDAEKKARPPGTVPRPATVGPREIVGRATVVIYEKNIAVFRNPSSFHSMYSSGDFTLGLTLLSGA